MRAQVREATKVDLPLDLFFDHSKLADLARVLDDRLGALASG